MTKEQDKLVGEAAMRAALKMAHKTFMQLNERSPRKEDGSGYFDKEINSCKEALEQPTVAQLNDEYLRDTNVIGLEQPAQEPVVFSASDLAMFQDNAERYDLITSLHAPVKEWQGLTDDEILAIPVGSRLSTARAIEQALKEKNANNN